MNSYISLKDEVERGGVFTIPMKLCSRYTMLASIAAFTVIGYPSKPDTNMSTWAKKKAKQELREEGLEF